jgi:hypothetical protein
MNKEAAMRTMILALAVVASPDAALAATLPLDDGDYTRGACTRGSSDILESFDIQTSNLKSENGKRILYPQAEGQDGGCLVKSVRSSGAIFTGSAECEDGGSRIRYSTGTYKFALEIVDRRTFKSKGRTYNWCAAHR